ncbi:hydrogenase maturation protease [Mycobacterium sp. ML4]
MIDRVVVIGLGNRYRRDDAVGIVAARAVDELSLPGVDVAVDIADPLALLDVWSGARLAIVVDAAVGTDSTAGRVRCCGLEDVVAGEERLSSHRIDMCRTHALGQALERNPRALRIFTVDVADTGHGVGLTPRVELAVPRVVALAVNEISCLAGYSTD